MNLTKKIRAKLDELIAAYQQGVDEQKLNIESEPPEFEHWYKDQLKFTENTLVSLKALRRQVEKHGPTLIDVNYYCDECQMRYPCTFNTEVATDLGIEVGE